MTKNNFIKTIENALSNFRIIIPEKLDKSEYAIPGTIDWVVLLMMQGLISSINMQELLSSEMSKYNSGELLKKCGAEQDEQLQQKCSDEVAIDRIEKLLNKFTSGVADEVTVKQIKNLTDTLQSEITQLVLEVVELAIQPLIFEEKNVSIQNIFRFLTLKSVQAIKKNSECTGIRVDQLDKKDIEDVIGAEWMTEHGLNLEDSDSINDNELDIAEAL